MVSVAVQSVMVLAYKNQTNGCTPARCSCMSVAAESCRAASEPGGMGIGRKRHESGRKHLAMPTGAYVDEHTPPSILENQTGGVC